MFPSRTASNRMSRSRIARFRASRVAMICLPLAMLAGCRDDMQNQPRYNPLRASTLFGDGRSARPRIPDTVAREELDLTETNLSGLRNGEPVDTFPFELTRADLLRGQQRFEIYCAPCHGRLGYGDGIIVRRGFPTAANYHRPELLDAPAGHFVDVMANGFGRMASYGDRIPMKDRWRIVGYIRVLQLSQNATMAQVPQGDRDQLEAQ